MPYEAFEASTQDGRPVELYRFERGLLVSRYTSDADPFTFDSATWLPATITRPEIEDSGEVRRSGVSLTVPRDFPIADLYRVTPPSDVVRVSILRVHRVDLDPEVIFLGRVLGCSFEGVSATLTCESVFTSVKRPGLRRKYSRTCPHVLYGAACGVVEASFTQGVTLAGVSGVTLNAAAFDAQPDGYFAGGVIEWIRPSGIAERRAIVSHVGANVVITHRIADLAPGALVAASPGCDRTIATCVGKFSNGLNFGGQPYIPIKNPFGGSSVF